jgi:hypothetical protein
VNFNQINQLISGVHSPFIYTLAVTCSIPVRASVNSNLTIPVSP